MEITHIFKNIVYRFPLARSSVALFRRSYWQLKRLFKQSFHIFYYRHLRYFYYYYLRKYFHVYKEVEIEVDNSTILKDITIQEIMDCAEPSQTMVVPGINVETKLHKLSVWSNSPTEKQLCGECTFWAPHLMLECLFDHYWFPESGFLVSKTAKVWRHSTLGQYMDPHFMSTCAVEEKFLNGKPNTFIFHEHLLEYAPQINEPLLITSHYASTNYGHFMLDMVPLIQVGMRLGLNMISTPLLEWQKPIYQRIGMDPENVVTVSEKVVFLKKVFVSNRHNANSTYSASPKHREVFAAILKNIPGSSMKRSQRRLFLSRGNTRNRNLRNRLALEETLRLEGFETVRPELLTFDEQALLFSDANFIVSEFGAIMTNVVFCREGTKVVEIIPEGQNDPWSKHLCASLGLEHVMLFHKVREEDRETLDIAGRTHKDIHFSYDANIELIRDVVKQL